MDEWDLIIVGAPAAAGAFAFLRLVANELMFRHRLLQVEYEAMEEEKTRRRSEVAANQAADEAPQQAEPEAA